MPDLMAERGGWALRAAEGDCVAARLEQGSHPRPTRQKCKRPRMGPFTFWRWSESAADDALLYSAPCSLFHGKFIGSSDDQHRQAQSPA